MSLVSRETDAALDSVSSVIVMTVRRLFLQGMDGLHKVLKALGDVGILHDAVAPLDVADLLSHRLADQLAEWLGVLLAR